MKKFEGMLICTDLDGTLLHKNKEVSKENLDAIEYFKSEGGLFTFITGRMPYCADEFYEMIHPNAPVGCINGGGIYDYKTKKYLWTQELSPKALELVAYAEQNMTGLGVQIDTFDHIYFAFENESTAWFREVTGMPNLVRSYRDVHEPIAKIVFGDADTENMLRLQELLKTHPFANEFDFIRSEKMLFEILPKGINKGSLLPHFSEILGISMDKTITVGDYNNDVEMLRAARLGIAVANATPEAKQAADYVTVSNTEHAIAKIIEELDLGILKL